jgi:hypothetical protein
MELKQVYGYEGLYLVSDTGKVFSEVFRNNKAVFKRRKELKLNSNGHGYLYVGLRKNGVTKRVYVHRLVAEHFLGKPPEGSVINHKDHDRSNNNASNLEWVSQAENVKYSALLMSHPKSKCKPTNTGEKYISFQKSGKSKYRVQIRKLNINKYFEALEEAVAFRNQILGKG